MIIKSGINENYAGYPLKEYMFKHNCIFIHIPKTAGTAVASCIMDDVSRDHFPQYVYQQANREFFKKAFKFAFVRNPWDRAVSMYSYLKTKGVKGEVDKYFNNLFNNEIDSFEKFISYLEEFGIDNFTLFQPQSFYLLDYKNEIAVDFVGRVESIDADFSYIKRQLSLNANLEQKNKSMRNNYTEYYTPELINRLADLYWKDIKYFNYDFDM